MLSGKLLFQEALLDTLVWLKVSSLFPPCSFISALTITHCNCPLHELSTPSDWGLKSCTFCVLAESGENHYLVNIRDSPDVHVFQSLGIAHGSSSRSFTSNPGHQLLDDMAQGFAQVSEVGAVGFQAKTPPAAHLFHSDNRESESPVHLTENH